MSSTALTSSISVSIKDGSSEIAGATMTCVLPLKKCHNKYNKNRKNNNEMHVYIYNFINDQLLLSYIPGQVDCDIYI